MKKTILFFIVVVLPFVIAAQNMTLETDRESIVQFVQEMYSSRIDNIAIYLSKDTIGKQKEYILNDKFHDGEILPYDESYISFIDLQPLADWGHPCEYLLINPITMEFTKIERQFMLIDHYKLDFEPLNDVDKYKQAFDELNLQYEQRIFELQEIARKNPILRTDDNKYAVLINGGASRNDNHLRYYNNIKLMYNTLVSQYNYNPDHIFVFFAGGAYNSGGYTDNVSTHVANGD